MWWSKELTQARHTVRAAEVSAGLQALGREGLVASVQFTRDLGPRMKCETWGETPI